jgi:beta-galactosidase
VKSGEGRGAANPKFDDSKWQIVDVPHDWAIDLLLVRSDDREVVEHAFRAIGPQHQNNSVGWYRRTFDIPKSDEGRRISVELDGVFRDSIVWINGHRLGRHPSGHTSFRYDLTDMLNYGGANVLTVRVDATSWEGWWYEGAGIYRHVCLVKTSPVHVGHWGTQVITRVGGTKKRRNEGSTKKAIVVVRTTVVNEGDERTVVNLRSQISNLKSQISNLKSEISNFKSQTSSRVRLEPWSQVEVEQKLLIPNAKLWSPDEPNLYTLASTIEGHDQVETTFGVRTLRWDARRGFFLNGKPLKIKGTCNHQNHAGVGTAMPDRLHEWRVRKLKEMGSNAYRCSHYAATPELLDICDRLGMLVMAENRLAGSGPEFLDDFKSMIRRDRNHPSIILWSIGNEEHTIQWKVAGERIGRTLVRTAHQLDPTRKVTCAMHDRGLGEGFANVVDVHGWNYIHVGDIEAFHQRRPEQRIVGSEEGSTVTTRGVYKDDPKRGYVSAYDVRAPKWGSTAEKWWTFFDARPWLAGGFVWTGFDYRGEPIPYKWPCTSSHFGLMDLCGFPKDLYWYYRAWWTDEPVLHVFPHWNWEKSSRDPIDVRAYSNCDEVELLVNDRSHGRKSVVHNSHVAWSVKYAPGTLEARGFRNGKLIKTTTIETAGSPTQLALDPGCKSIDADGQDIALLSVRALDAQGRAVPTASNLIHFEITGAGKLLGVGNGDPSSHETDHAHRRRLFNGLAMVLVQSIDGPGAIVVRAESKGLRTARVAIATKRCPLRPSVP